MPLILIFGWGCEFLNWENFHLGEITHYAVHSYDVAYLMSRRHVYDPCVMSSIIFMQLCMKKIETIANRVLAIHVVQMSQL